MSAVPPKKLDVSLSQEAHGPGLPLSATEQAALAALHARTPARLAVGRSGPAYRTQTQLELRTDHAAAVDAVHAELDLKRDLGTELVERFGLFEVTTRAADKATYLQRPDLGRQFSDMGLEVVMQHCPRGADLQIVIGDGLSAAAVAEQVPLLLPHLVAEAQLRHWTLGQTFAIRHCRVGVLNAIGAALEPRVVVLLIGERPGLASAVSLSAYLAYQPRPDHTDAQRNLISNIHARGIPAQAAAQRIMALADQMCALQTSGVAVKEQLGTPALPPSAAALEQGQQPRLP